MAIASLNRKPISRYQAPSAASHRPPPPLPPRWVERELRVEMPPLSHFLMLSFLLHILAIALVGAPTGGSREGRAMWGSLLVTLMPARPSAPPAPIGPAAEEALPAPLAFPRLLDRIPSAEPRRDATPPLVVPPPIAAESTAPLETAAPAPAPPPAPSVSLPVIEVPRVQLAPAIPQAERALIEAPRVLVAPAPAAPPVESIAPPRRVEPLSRPLDHVLTQEIATPPPGTPLAERAPRLEPATRIEREAPPKAEAQSAPSPFRTPGPSAPRTNDASSYDPTAPGLDPEALRRRAATLAREGSGQRAILPFPMPPVPEKKNRIEDILDKARKPDCRTAYQQLGLAAIVPLLANEIGEGTCRW